jgi:hypothetical protein
MKDMKLLQDFFQDYKSQLEFIMKQLNQSNVSSGYKAQSTKGYNDNSAFEDLKYLACLSKFFLATDPTGSYNTDALWLVGALTLSYL